MQLIGMLDSPYVRRVAVSLQLLGLPFEHRSVSVFRGFAQFEAINPVVKAPTLVCDDGTVLMDSTLQLQYVESLAGRSLLPRDSASLARELRLMGLALAACEKSAQIVYERALRPAEKRHDPWVQRVTGQLLAAYGELERELAARPLAVDGLGQAAISVAVAWTFTQSVLGPQVPAADFPSLAAFAAACETLPVFQAIPCDDAVTLQAG